MSAVLWFFAFISIVLAVVGALPAVVKPKPETPLAAIFDFLYGFGSISDLKDRLNPNGKALTRPGTYRKFPLGKRQEVSENVFRLMFKLPSSQSTLGVPAGKYVKVRAKIDGKMVERNYTPVSADVQGYFDLVVKVYKNGTMSKHLTEQLKYGDEIEFSGPYGDIEYKGNGVFKIAGNEIRASKVGMVAGGSGLTAMLSIMRMILQDPTDTTQVYLVYANKSEEDIIIQGKLEQFQESHPNFKVQFVLEELPCRARTSTRDQAKRETFPNYGTGHISPIIMKRHLPEASLDSLLLICGPESMCRSVEMHADILGYPKQRVFSFDS
jgi:cytochrome-b5 reductase